MRIKIHVTAKDSEPDLVAEVAKWAVDHCPVSDAIRRAIPTTVEVNHQPD
jgi:organic hydroperoxide reductase OsmC/OhrA